jgi:hypothetical protein
MAVVLGMGFVSGAVQVAPDNLGEVCTATDPGPPGPPFFLPLMEKEKIRPLVNPFVTPAGDVTFTSVKHNGIDEQFSGVTPVPFA